MDIGCGAGGEITQPLPRESGGHTAQVRVYRLEIQSVMLVFST